MIGPHGSRFCDFMSLSFTHSVPLLLHSLQYCFAASNEQWKLTEISHQCLHLLEGRELRGILGAIRDVLRSKAQAKLQEANEMKLYVGRLVKYVFEGGGRVK
ncbi:hypothetical protein F5050DRAFT_1114450 [Lentinula boryana]|uniref:ARM repeat-containing protein n=1 Tax=Lentinula boryana TaxID=40481 RepID=A0ABQ8PZH9_9AGAR|nr:hypothetical protein F5050DRAFT_1114450 [Lentinula boryana]